MGHLAIEKPTFVKTIVNEARKKMEQATAAANR